MHICHGVDSTAHECISAAVELQVVAVNPGRLAKGNAGGTYAHLRIGPSPEGQALAAGRPAATNAPVPHRVDRRCRVECRRV